MGQSYCAYMPQLRRLANTVESFSYILDYSRLHSGGGTPGNVAEFPSSAAVHVVVRFPISSKSGLQV